VTFAPTRINIHEAEAVIERARDLGAFRFNTGTLMRIGTAARLWSRLEPSAVQYGAFRALLDRRSAAPSGDMELCYEPFTVADGLRASLEVPPATLLVLPNGWVKVAAALPQVCADLRQQTLREAWEAYRNAWSGDKVRELVRDAIDDASRHAQANTWQTLVGPSAIGRAVPL
jgi:MoaA/NifB/PqqE/SkfB family radical SAM enzyme